MTGPLLALLVLLASGAAAQEAVAPTLSGAPPVPSTVTICIDRSAQRCWNAVIPSECANRSRGAAEVFAAVPAGSPEAGQRLRACWDEVKR